MAPDPYRILGLTSGATAAEVKRAYRALAKANHPDSAGERALPRFLAIQAAYEQLASARGPGSGRVAGTPAEPWRAEPERAREARRRARQASEGQAAGGHAAGGRAAGSDSGAPAGAGPASQARRGPGSASGPARGTAAGGATPGGAGGGGGPRRRATRKATFGSTSYDGARDTADPTWEGAAWYGQSSGEFWTVNPREYADPRKHGPEYQSRAADRAARAQARAQADGPGVADDATAARPDGGTARARAQAQERARAATAAHAAAARADAEARARAAEAAAFARPAPSGGASRAGEAGAGPAPSGTSAPPEWATAAGEPPALLSALLPSVDLSVLERSSFRRLLLALIAWPPIGIAAAALIGESTGCAAFSASCTPEGAALPWIAQAVILLVLLAVPLLSRILIGGTAAVLIVAFPAAATLSASGARYDRAYGPGSLLAILSIAWLIGVAVLGIRAVRKRSAA